MMTDLQEKAEKFRTLHKGAGTFLMPNAWNAGSARMLSAAGFPAIATSSSGIAFSLGLPDYDGCISRDQMMTHIQAISGAVDLPVSADLEAGYGNSPADVAATVRQAISAGAVGGSIEDYTGNPHEPIYETNLAVDRIKAARQAANGTGVSFTLTARTDCFMTGHQKPFAEAVRRANLYRVAGADCVFVPGVTDRHMIAALVREVMAPLAVVVGFAGTPLRVAELEEIGVKRISIGGSLARATFALIQRAANEMIHAGTFSFAETQIPDAELSNFFAAWEAR